MGDIQYIGEHLWPGNLGRFATIFSFIFSLLAAFSFFASERKNGDIAWKKLGRWSYYLHGVGIFAVVGLLFYVVINHYYEYQYVFKNVNEDLPFQYIFSSFWADQQGSFLLWMIWHVVLGFILMRTAKNWEAPVMGTLSLVQVFLCSMLLGIYVGFGDDPMKIGVDPFILLRHHMDAPIFANADYLSLIKGQGLNPLLQNYWMVIHPPITFLGFASTVVPFCFAIGGLIRNDHKSWIKPVLPWALFSGAILGTGILMGGAWAYEALSFGGYWAWDPVENMSLVPWLLLVAGIHVNLINKTTNYSATPVYLFYILSFGMILYSTFLTRSGILGETSVHAFTEMGLENQLLFFVLFMMLGGLIFLLIRRKSIPSPKKEESLSSKEFWMFIGSLVLVFSAVMITASSSLPIYNKIRAVFDPEFIGRVIDDPIEHYNKYQLWIAVFIGVLSASTQFLRWKESRFEKYWKKYVLYNGIALVAAGLISFAYLMWLEVFSWEYFLLLFSAAYAVAANSWYLIKMAKFKPKASASAISHVGFGVMIIGVLASGLNQFHISKNRFAQQNLLPESMLDKNILLFEKLPMMMEGFRVTYEGDRFEGNNRIYDVLFEEINMQTGALVDSFRLYPTAVYNNTVTKIAAFNPSTKHNLGKDIFTHIASIAPSEGDIEEAKAFEDSLNYKTVSVGRDFGVFYDSLDVGEIDSSIVREYQIRMLSLEDTPDHPTYVPEKGDISLNPRYSVYDKRSDSTYLVTPSVVLRGAMVYTYPVHIQDLSLKIKPSEEAFDQLLRPESDLNYTRYAFKVGETKTIEGFQIAFTGFEKNPENPAYEPQQGDIAVAARMQITDETGLIGTANPIYCIRENQPFNLKDVNQDAKLHFRFLALDPLNEVVTLAIAKENYDIYQEGILTQLAHAPRTDFIVLESIVFPGINLFWAGAIIMLLGLALGMFNRMKTKLR